LRWLRSLFAQPVHDCALAVIRHAKIHGTKHRPWLTALLCGDPRRSRLLHAKSNFRCWPFASFAELLFFGRYRGHSGHRDALWRLVSSSFATAPRRDDGLHPAALVAEPLRYNKNSNALSSANPKKALQATVAAIPNTTTVREVAFRSIFRRSCMLPKTGEPQAGPGRGAPGRGGRRGTLPDRSVCFKQTIKIKTNV
jgi:hypothetical protein